MRGNLAVLETPMKVLVLGGTGMIGHRVWASLSQLGHDVYALCRSDLKDDMHTLPGIDWSKCWTGIDVTDLSLLEGKIREIKPEIVINCVGIVKQNPLSKDPLTTIHLNALLPHQIAKVCGDNGARMIQMSTDCVFQGDKGNYQESDNTDATDLYGKSKALGEVVDQEHVLTIRTSTIGLEIHPHGGLIEWLVSQKNKEIKGFSEAIYSGFPTHTYAKILNEFVLPNHSLHGVIHISSQPINKYDLLKMTNEIFDLGIRINKEDSFVMKRGLDSSLFRKKTGAPLFKWADIIHDLKHDLDFYKTLKRL